MDSNSILRHVIRFQDQLGMPKPKKQNIIDDARMSTATGRWHLWTNRMEKGNNLLHSSNIPLAGFILIPRTRTSNACTLTFRIHLNMGAQMKITAIADPRGPRQLAATCRETLPPARGNLPLLAASA